MSSGHTGSWWQTRVWTCLLQEYMSILPSPLPVFGQPLGCCNHLWSYTLASIEGTYSKRKKSSWLNNNFHFYQVTIVAVKQQKPQNEDILCFDCLHQSLISSNLTIPAWTGLLLILTGALLFKISVWGQQHRYYLKTGEKQIGSVATDVRNQNLHSNKSL